MSPETTTRSRFREGELEELMKRYQHADEEATGSLIEKVSPQIFRYFLGQVRDRSAAEDLLQDFWLRIHGARRTYRPLEPVLPWMYAIARRVRVDQYRKASRIRGHEVQVETLPDAGMPPEPETEEVDVRPLLEALPATQREVILMLKVSGLSLEEVARATKSSVGSVKQKAHRAYVRLRGLLGDPTSKKRGADDAA